jgi:hypothetical protein
MWGTIAILGSVVALVVGLAWWIRRHQNQIDEYEEQREYKDPPVFQGPDGLL